MSSYKTNHIKRSLQTFFSQLPEETQQELRLQEYIKTTYQQFSEVVDGVILQHVNSLYLTKDKLSSTNQKRLVVYVDSSLVAAELNARRELIKLQYREKFNVQISEFEIKISRRDYKNIYPFKELNQKQDKLLQNKTTQIDQVVFQTMNNQVQAIKNPIIRESFKEVLRAYMRKPELLQQKKPKDE